MAGWPTNEGVKVSHGYGDSEDMPNYSDREFHQGTDIPGISFGVAAHRKIDPTQILAVVDGVLKKAPFPDTYCIIPSKESGLDYIFSYSHVWKPKKVKYGKKKIGTHILYLKHEKNWIEKPRVCDHLHFEVLKKCNSIRGFKNPLEVLPHKNEDHNVTVTIEQFRYVRRSGDAGPVRYLSDVSPIVKDALILRSDIVIIASGEDIMGYNEPDPRAWTPGVHKLEYEVENVPTSSIKINKMKLLEWKGPLPADRHYRVIYNMGPRPCRTTFHFNYYVVTNTNNSDPINDDDFSQWWKTNAKTAGPAGNGKDADDAKLNSQALFPDGIYKVKVTGYDIKGGSDTDEKAVVLDNFKPFVKKVTVKIGEDVKYDASWPETDRGALEALRRDTDNACNARTLTFEVFFSETMDDAWADFKVEIQPSGSSVWINVGDSISWSKENFDNDKWTGRVILPEDAASGEAQIRIKARDLAGNELDTDPQNIAEFNRASASWSNYSSGSDENHKIKIEASKGSFSAKIIKKAE